MTYNILLPTDGSIPALAATVKAVEMAKERDSTLTILKVVEQDPTLYTERVAEGAALQRHVEEDGVQYAKTLAASNGVKTVTMVREGAVTGEILKASEEINADLIVMGKSEPHGLPRLYLGDVAESVVAKAHCTVLVVRPTEKEVSIAKALVVKPAEPSTAGVVRKIVQTRKFKVGLVLFTIYVVGYAMFVIGGTYFRLISGGFFGTQIAIISGLVLIIEAIIMAVTFNWYADRREKMEAG